MQAFQIWYLASYPEVIGHETELVRKSQLAFPDLGTLSRETRLIRGAKFIEQLKIHFPQKERLPRNLKSFLGIAHLGRLFDKIRMSNAGHNYIMGGSSKYLIEFFRRITA